MLRELKRPTLQPLMSENARLAFSALWGWKGGLSEEEYVLDEAWLQ